MFLNIHKNLNSGETVLMSPELKAYVTWFVYILPSFTIVLYVQQILGNWGWKNGIYKRNRITISIHKSDTQQDVKNYRLVWLRPISSKIFVKGFYIMNCFALIKVLFYLKNQVSNHDSILINKWWYLPIIALRIWGHVCFPGRF